MTTPNTSNEQRTTNNEPVVAFAAIEKSFFGVKLLKGVSFSAGAGRIVGLVGENGAGKSTLMNLLGGILQPNVGASAWMASPTHRGIRTMPAPPASPSCIKG